MCSRFPELGLLAALLVAGPSGAAPATEGRVLRVCADPDNLPYSHADGSGFENRIAVLLAEELHATLQYDWWPQRRGYVRKTMGAGMCDVFVGVPASFDRVSTTRPYYRSSYVFVTRRGDSAPAFGTPQITRRRIGVQLVGNDMAATPPGHALTRAGATANVTGFTVFGDGPAAQRMVAAVAAGDLDAALVWGPQAGYFAHHAATPMSVRMASAPPGPEAPFEFSIAMGVRRGNDALRDEIDAFLVHRRADIDAILAAYQVPRTDGAAGAQP
jgi:quinoprotein dehydrogenase-associated probable ABC transporter substrate-binding protein